MTSTSLFPPMQGRGLWYGAQKYTLNEFDRHFHYASSIGMQIVHPKVGDGTNAWYDDTFLTYLKQVAEHYKLECVPYHYCYGNTFGALDGEADLCAHIGTLFGAVSPDIESEWDHHADWALQFGNRVRKSFHGPVYPTVFANPEQHPTPLAHLNTWVNGFLPQVYFSVWNQPTAQHAVEYFLPQWERLQLSLGKTILQPILPIISLGNGVSPQEIHNFLILMQNYGYCGFWYDGQMTDVYASSIRSAPTPRFVTASAPPPTHTTTTPTPTHPSSAPGPSPHGPPVVVDESFLNDQVTKDDTAVAYNQNLTNVQLAAIWHAVDSSIPFNTMTAICAFWVNVVQRHPDWFVGAPLFTEKQATVDSVHFSYIDFVGGKRIVWFPLGGQTAIVPTPMFPILSPPTVETGTIQLKAIPSSSQA